jgi:Leucine-rich repeat (LRR) protein
MLTRPVLFPVLPCRDALTLVARLTAVPAFAVVSQLPALPKALRSLRCEGCTSLRKLPDLAHTSLTCLDCDYCSRLTALPELPAHTLEEVFALCLERVTVLPRLPARGLQELNIYGAAIASLPKTLPPIGTLDLSGTLISHLPTLQGCDHLDVSGCKQLQQLPECLPDSLTYLNCSGCAALQQLPARLPPSLRKLYLTDCTALEQLPQQLPESLRVLCVARCSSLQQLPPLPAELQYLGVKGCDAIKVVRMGGCKVVFG